MADHIIKIAPGLGLAAAIALIARLVHGFVPADLAAAVSPVLLAVLLGILVANLRPLPAIFGPVLMIVLFGSMRT